MDTTPHMPSYLKDYQSLYLENPRLANQEWFKTARYGLFIHYGLFSATVKTYGISAKPQEWVQHTAKIHVAEYGQLEKQFTAEDFSAQEIVQLAKQAGMRYINFTTRHHDSFCLFDTKETEFNSLHAPAGRDLVRELAQECEAQGIALFAYYSHGRDWRHPHAPNNDQYGGAARPEYDTPEPTYAYDDAHDLTQYLNFMKAQITELLTQYPTIAGIWLDGIATPVSGDFAAFRVQELYDHIRAISPHALISYKQGLLGTEDFFAPEHKIPTAASSTEISAQDQTKQKNAIGKIESAPEKTLELCTTMIVSPVSWGFKGEDCIHLSSAQVEEKLQAAIHNRYNLLLNIGLTPTGKVEHCDQEALIAVGEKIKNGQLIL